VRYNHEQAIRAQPATWGAHNRIDEETMSVSEKVGLVLLAVMLLALIAVVGPPGLGAAVGALAMVGMLRLAGPRPRE
jgi:hypothetical protein